MTKRFRVGGEEVEMESINMANMLMFLSHSAHEQHHHHHHHHHHHQQQQQQHNNKSSSTAGKLFECKTCNRRFTSFQALGGHRASHKKPKAMADGGGGEVVVKPKVHECSVCGLEFAIGQALGGHMRRHRGLSEGGIGIGNGHEHDHDHDHQLVQKKSHGRRVLCLDLNLPPVDGGDHDEQWLKIGTSLDEVFGGNIKWDVFDLI
ncbi:putative transcription factor C2H2 family [Dioscorea sansibarensis]